ncbi:hypothetical protein ABG79_02147 [Caloramator mitchellensis]|uniref:HTH cro/C1-type domain-containing protein n=1 Tax=Caloramator mitchellensis TaxID=908809 RepID=A0A0R3K163_CALMK|nr:helix-turn-helix domain-containing protein [Caloramator mitchellensis]KRQ86015.1 hypothetical protein ABG79_02147 [Caloramator mitchellensis]
MALVANINEFNKLQQSLGLNYSQLAAKIGVSRTQLWRVLKQQCVPGEQFIAGFKAAFPNQDLEKFFLLKMVQQSDTTSSA